MIISSGSFFTNQKIAQSVVRVRISVENGFIEWSDIVVTIEGK